MEKSSQAGSAQAAFVGQGWCGKSNPFWAWILQDKLRQVHMLNRQMEIETSSLGESSQGWEYEYRSHWNHGTVLPLTYEPRTKLMGNRPVSVAPRGEISTGDRTETESQRLQPRLFVYCFLSPQAGYAEKKKNFSITIGLIKIYICHLSRIF